MKSLLNADSGVTNTIDTSLGGRRLSHSTYEIPNYMYRRYISARNAINSTITMVVPPSSIHAGNINNMLLPLPVGIMAITMLSLFWMARIAGACIP